MMQPHFHTSLSRGITPLINFALSCIADLDDDLLKANELLEDLEKDDLRELFKELGLSEKTVKNKYAAATTAYANDLLRNWIIQKDDVLKKGGATWPNLKAALIRKKQAGIAAEIHVQ